MSQRYLIQIHEHEPQYFVYDFEGSATPAYVYQDMQRGKVPDLTGAKLVIDIGANVGMWAFRMAKLYPDLKILAFEPCAENIKHFEWGIEANGFQEQIELFPLAVTERGQDILLVMDPTNSGSASMYNAPVDAFRKERVKSVSLNDVVRPYDSVDALKIDIEGAEFHLFNGFENWDKIKKIYLEVHPNFLAGTQDEKLITIKKFVDNLRAKIGAENVFVDCTDTNYRSF